MKMLLHCMLLGLALIQITCTADQGTKGGNEGGGASDSNAAGTIIGQLEIKEGAPESSISNATIAFKDHPAITATSGSDGSIDVKTAPVGSLEIFVTSNDSSAGLIGGSASKYGIRLENIFVSIGEATDIGNQVMKETGSISGKVDFYENPNNLDLTGSDVFIPGTSWIAKTDKDGKFSIPGIPEGVYKVRVQHTGFAVSELAGIEISEATDTDIGTALLSLARGPEGTIEVEKDLTASIDGEARDIVKSRTIAINLAYDSDAVLMKVSDEPSFLNKSWSPVEKTAEFTFTSDGSKSIYVMFSDLNGLESSPYSADFIVDTEAPTISSFNILNGWDEISSSATSAYLNISSADTGAGVKEVIFCNNSSFTGCSYETYTTTKYDWTVAATTYVKVKDYAGNVSSVGSDTIFIGSHTILPSGTISANTTLYAAQSPYRYDANLTFSGNLTIEPGVTLDCASGTTATITVNGRINAAGTLAEPITITKSGSVGFATLDLSNSVASNNIVSYWSIGAGVKSMTSSFLKINGGTVSNNTIELASGGGFLEKTGYKALTVSGNTVTTVDTYIVRIVTGSNTTITDNNFSGGVASNGLGMIWQAGGTSTNVTYNTIANTVGMCTAVSAPGIWVDDGTMNVAYNNISATCTTGAGYGIGVSNIGGEDVSVTYNNIEVNNGENANNTYHLSATNAATTITASYNFYDGTNAANPNFEEASGGDVTSTNDQGSPWTIAAGAGCVGHLCN